MGMNSWTYHDPNQIYLEWIEGIWSLCEDVYMYSKFIHTLQILGLVKSHIMTVKTPPDTAATNATYKEQYAGTWNIPL